MKVVVALDDSSHSAHLVENVVHKKWPQDTEFKIISVVEPIDPSEEREMGAMAFEMRKRRHNTAETLCQHARERIQEAVDGAHVHFEIREGDACCELIEAAADWNADKMLLGAHSRAVCPHNLLGSVSRAVSQHAPCTVEIVRDTGRLAHTHK